MASVDVLAMAAPNKVTPAIRTEILRLWNERRSQIEIGKALNLNRATVARVLRKAYAVETPDWKGAGRVAVPKPENIITRPIAIVYPDNPPRLETPFELSFGEANRFWSKVAAPNANGCRLWLASTNIEHGAGQFGTTESNASIAHRVAWRLTYGPIPDGMNVLHRCDIRPCVEPTHFWLGTQADNMQDMATKGRALGTHEDTGGENNAAATLTWERVRKMRELRAKHGFTYDQLAEKFGISKSQVSHIITGKQWIE